MDLSFPRIIPVKCKISGIKCKILPSELLERKLAVITANILYQNTARNDSRFLNAQCDVN